MAASGNSSDKILALKKLNRKVQNRRLYNVRNIIQDIYRGWGKITRNNKVAVNIQFSAKAVTLAETKPTTLTFGKT